MQLKEHQNIFDLAYLNKVIAENDQLQYLIHSLQGSQQVLISAINSVKEELKRSRRKVANQDERIKRLLIMLNKAGICEDPVQAYMPDEE